VLLDYEGGIYMMGGYCLLYTSDAADE